MEVKGNLAKLMGSTTVASSKKLVDILGQKLIRPLPVTEVNNGVHLVKLVAVKEGERGFRFTVTENNTEYSISMNINNNEEMFLESIGHLANQLDLQDGVLSTASLQAAAAKSPEIYVLAQQKGAYTNYSFNLGACAAALVEANISSTPEVAGTTE